MSKYRLRYTEVEAIRWTGDNLKEVAKFTGLPVEASSIQPFACYVGKKGDLRAVAHRGDLIVRDHEGKLTTYSKDKFEEKFLKYEPVSYELSDPAQKGDW